MAQASAAGAVVTEPDAKPAYTPSWHRLLKRTGEKKKQKKRFRGAPDPLTYDLEQLPDSALLSGFEAAAAVRRPIATLEAWRLNPNHPLRWRRVAGRPLYEVGSIRKFLQGDAKQQTAAPKRGRGGIKERPSARTTAIEKKLQRP
jgi:hypothetical protein